MLRRFTLLLLALTLLTPVLPAQTITIFGGGGNVPVSTTAPVITPEDEAYYFPSDGGVPAVPVPTHPDFLRVLDGELQFLTRVGLNKDSITTADFEIRTYRWGSAGLQALLKHRKTGSTTLSDVGVVLRYSAYPLAVDLVRLARTAGGR